MRIIKSICLTAALLLSFLLFSCQKKELPAAITPFNCRFTEFNGSLYWIESRPEGDFLYETAGERAASVYEGSHLMGVFSFEGELYLFESRYGGEQTIACLLKKTGGSFCEVLAFPFPERLLRKSMGFDGENLYLLSFRQLYVVPVLQPESYEVFSLPMAPGYDADVLGFSGQTLIAYLEREEDDFSAERLSKNELFLQSQKFYGMIREGVFCREGFYSFAQETLCPFSYPFSEEEIVFISSQPDALWVYVKPAPFGEKGRYDLYRLTAEGVVLSEEKISLPDEFLWTSYGFSMDPPFFTTGSFIAFSYPQKLEDAEYFCELPQDESRYSYRYLLLREENKLQCLFVTPWYSEFS